MQSGRRKRVQKEWVLMFLPLGLCFFLWVYVFSFGFMFFFWIYGFRLGLWFPLGLRCFFGFMIFVWVYVCVFPFGVCYSCIHSFRWTIFLRSFGFGYMLFLCFFGFGYKVIWDGTGDVSSAQMAREELWQEDPFLITTATQLGRGLSYGRWTQTQGWRRLTGLWGLTGIQG